MTAVLHSNNLFLTGAEIISPNNLQTPFYVVRRQIKAALFKLPQKDQVTQQHFGHHCKNSKKTKKLCKPLWQRILLFFFQVCTFLTESMSDAVRQSVLPLNGEEG